jgi:GDPmannose 4,6-dehydratase
VEVLLGDPSKARSVLGWKPSVTFPQLVAMMVDADLQNAERELYLDKGGYGAKRFHE